MARRRHVEARAAGRTAALFLSALLYGCTGPLSALDPAGPSAQAIADLWWAMFWGAAALFAGVMALLMLAMWRPAALARWSGRHFIVYGGLAMPSAVLLALLVYALAMGERLIARPLAQPPLQVEVEARMWMWEFSYPGTAGASSTFDRLHIPAGRPVDLVVTSTDVIHSFWVPRLGGKIDAVPGHRNVIRLEADRPGIYRGICSEYCGIGHAEMDFAVVVHEEGDYEAALLALARESGE